PNSILFENSRILDILRKANLYKRHVDAYTSRLSFNVLPVCVGCGLLSEYSQPTVKLERGLAFLLIYRFAKTNARAFGVFSRNYRKCSNHVNRLLGKVRTHFS